MKLKRYALSLLSALIHTILIIVVLFIFGNKIVANKETCDDKNAFSKDINSNFIVYGLSDEQQAEYKGFDNVDYLCSYYRYETIFTINGKGYSNKIAIFKDSNIAKTPFDESRLIESSTNSNSIYIDYSFAKKNKLNLNDSFKIKFGNSEIDVTVSKIYKTNYFDDVHAMVIYNDFKETLDNLFANFKTNYSYIHTTDVEGFDNYLKSNYVPKAFMKTKDDFPSDIDYAIYENNYLSKDYYNSANVEQIQAQDTDSLSVEANKSLTVSLIIIILGIILCDVLIGILYARKIKLVSNSTNDYKSYSKIHIVSMVISLVLGLFLIIIKPLSVTSSLVSISFVSATLKLLPLTISFVLSVIVGFGIKYYFTYSTLSSQRKKKAAKKGNSKTDTNKKK